MAKPQSDSNDFPITQDKIGLVTAYFGHRVAIEINTGEVLIGQLQRNQPLPLVGDRVVWEEAADNAVVIQEILPRRTMLMRGGKGGKPKPLAANIDVMVIVMAAYPGVIASLVDQYLIAAELLGIMPLIVINKIDLLSREEQALLLETLAAYRSVSYSILFSSIYTENGLVGLKEYLSGKSGVLLGPSGVGKSSLIAALTQADLIQVGEVSAKGAGKHTTTATKLYHLPSKGYLIDSPGVREFHLWPLTQAELVKGFREFSSFIGQCRFRDCQHNAEPNCAIENAVKSGKIHSDRLKTYRSMLNENKK